MFSAVGKLYSHLFGTSKPDEDQERKGPTESKTDISLTSAVECREFEGTVTYISSNHGLIDDEVYFSFDQVLGTTRLQKNDQVHVKAVRQYEGGGWHAEQVSLTDNWDIDGGDLEQNDLDLIQSRPLEMVGTVTYFNNTIGNVNDNVYFDLQDCKSSEGYWPNKGDWVKVKVKYDDHDTIALTIEPLRVKEAEGVVSGVMGDHGYIDGEVFYEKGAICDGYKPQKWEPVHYRAIESQQGRCSWRAVLVEPSRKPHLANLRVLQGPLQKTFTEELLSNKQGIEVTEADFGEVGVSSSHKLTVWVKNNGTVPQKLCRCHLTATASQISVVDIKLLKEYSSMMKDCSNTSVTGEVTLYPAMCLYINLRLEARSPGQEKPLLILTFENFKIGRYVTATITDPMAGLLDRSEAYVRGAGGGYGRYRANVETANTPWMVPGQRPSISNRTVQFPHRLPHYDVPQDLREAIIDQEDVLSYIPVLEEELCMQNYRERFKFLLHLEEIQEDIDIREFDLVRVCLRHMGEYLGLKVPGLAESRPSVLIGDKVILTDPTDPEGPCFEGYVHELTKDEVLLKFNPAFQNSYTGKDYNVQFTYNRGPLRKQHRATEMAKGLGAKVLFPTSLHIKPAQCVLHKGYLQSLSQTKVTGSPTSLPVSAARAKLPFFNRRLNARQRSAVTRIVEGQGRPVPYILFGPPGTGKTVTVVEAILQIFTQLPGSRIIACTPSNSAADLITERLHDSGLLKTGDLVRLNALQRNEETIPDVIKPYCTVGDDLDLASRYRVLVSTCVSAGSLYSLGIKAGHFTHVFIDEAGQATEPEAMIAACLVSHTDGQIVLAGDPQQLGPVLRSTHAKTYGLQLSLLERLTHSPLYNRDELKFVDHGAYDPFLVTKLVENYRSHAAILDLPSRLFYHGELEERADRCLSHTFVDWPDLPVKGVPVIFHGIRGEDMREGNSPSWFNAMEAFQVVRYLQSVLAAGRDISCDDVGIITPYRKQVEKIRLLLDKLSIGKVKVGSVEEFQGQERQVIIISTVRANEEFIGFDEKRTIGFLSNPKRFNVAITRAQALLVVIGNPHVLTQDVYWKALIDYCVEIGAYVGCELPPSAVDL